MSTRTDQHPAPGDLNVSIDLIRPSAGNRRKKFGDLTSLAASIRTYGLIEPLVVVPAEDGGWELVAGERRYRAAVLAECTTVPIVVRAEEDRLQLLGIQLAENIERLDLSPSEVVDGVQELLELGATDDCVATTLAMPTDDAATLRGLLALGEPIRDLLADRVISIGEARPLVDLCDVEPQYVEAVAVKIRNRWAVRDAMRQVLAARKRDRIVADARDLVEKRNLRLIDRPRYDGYGIDSVRRLGRGSMDVQVATREHAKLPCHAAFIDDEASSARAAVVLVCTDPDSHREEGEDEAAAVVDGVLPVAAVRHEPTPAEKALETKRHRQSWRLTHGPRNAFIAGCLPSLPLDDAMKRVAFHVMQERGFPWGAHLDAARLLVGDGESVPEDDSSAVHMLRDRAAIGGETAIRVALAMLTARAEHVFQLQSAVDGERDNLLAHFNLLAQHGYAIQDAEQNHVRREYGCALTDAPVATAAAEDSSADTVEDDHASPCDGDQVVDDEALSA